VLFDRMIVHGLDIHVRRVISGPITINSIAFTDLLPRPSGSEAVAEPAEAANGVDNGWGVGINKFEFRNSRVLLTPTAGGRMEVDVERIELRDFHTWAPDRPSTFTLRGEANDITFSVEGEARPFADVLSIDASGRMEDIRLNRVCRFTGSLVRLDPRQGVLDARFDIRANLYPDGRIAYRRSHHYGRTGCRSGAMARDV
jgi:hypothetical protein